MSWPKELKLTDAEIEHLEVTGACTGPESMMRTFLAQAKDRRKSKFEPCFECIAIAKKLGLLEEE